MMNKPFVYINDEDVNNFIATHANTAIYEVFDQYTNKIAFLGSTGQIMSHGNIYGLDINEYNSLKESIGDVESILKEING